MGETCVDGDQDVISEEGQGGRCNELVRKNQSSMLYVLDAKNSVGIFFSSDKTATPQDSRTNPS